MPRNNQTTGTTTGTTTSALPGNGQATRQRTTRSRHKGARGRLASNAGNGAIPGRLLSLPQTPGMTPDQRKFYDMGLKHGHERCGVTFRG